MLRHTFCHLPGIDLLREARLWRAGVFTWEDLWHVSPQLRQELAPDWQMYLAESMNEYAAGNVLYFAERLRSSCRWRLFADFRQQCAYFDIETTGLSARDQITTAALYDGRQIRTYIAGQNLEALAADLTQYPLLVTYNGTHFDLPFVQRHFGRRLWQAHVDLRYVLSGLNLRGGQKRCEAQLGIGRQGLEEVSGWTAVLLWEEYRRRGDPAALQTLLAYNVQDVLNLEQLLAAAYNRGLAHTPFADRLRLPPPATPANPFQPDQRLLQRLYHRWSFWTGNW
jgi:uncharacterized protein YprB with RNaseH-like and TPR domain